MFSVAIQNAPFFVSSARLFVGDLVHDVLLFKIKALIQKFVFSALTLRVAATLNRRLITPHAFDASFSWHFTFALFPFFLRALQQGVSVKNALHFMVISAALFNNWYYPLEMQIEPNASPIGRGDSTRGSYMQKNVRSTPLACFTSMLIACTVAKLWIKFMPGR